MPTPSCKDGYTEDDLKSFLTEERLKEFFRWMRGQTCPGCDGREYDHEAGEYFPTGCGPHGIVYYSWDVQRFLDGRPIID